MNSAKKALVVVLLLVTLSFWGCAQKQTPVGSARVRDLETRNAKLEEDYRVAVGQRDLARKKQGSAEEENASLTQQLSQQLEQLQTATRERAELRVRVGDRDNLHAQLVQLGKELQGLAGRIDSAINNTPAPPVTAAPTVPAVPRS